MLWRDFGLTPSPEKTVDRCYGFFFILRVTERKHGTEKNIWSCERVTDKGMAKIA
jgi:hypothetical protein